MTSQRTASSSTRTGMWVDRDLDVGLRPLDQVLARQAEAGLVEAGEQDLVGLEGAHGVVEGERRSRVHDRALGLDPELLEHRLGHLDPALGGVADARRRSTIWPTIGWFCGADDGEVVGARLDALADAPRAACGRRRPR